MTTSFFIVSGGLCRRRRNPWPQACRGNTAAGRGSGYANPATAPRRACRQSQLSGRAACSILQPLKGCTPPSAAIHHPRGPVLAACCGDRFGLRRPRRRATVFLENLSALERTSFISPRARRAAGTASTLSRIAHAGPVSRPCTRFLMGNILRPHADLPAGSWCSTGAGPRWTASQSMILYGSHHRSSSHRQSCGRTRTARRRPGGWAGERFRVLACRVGPLPASPWRVSRPPFRRAGDHCLDVIDAALSG